MNLKAIAVSEREPGARANFSRMEIFLGLVEQHVKGKAVGVQLSAGEPPIRNHRRLAKPAPPTFGVAHENDWKQVVLDKLEKRRRQACFEILGNLAHQRQRRLLQFDGERTKEIVRQNEVGGKIIGLALRIKSIMRRISDIRGRAIEYAALMIVPMADFVGEREALACRNALRVYGNDGPLLRSDDRGLAFVERAVMNDGSTRPGDRVKIDILGRDDPQIEKNLFSRRQYRSPLLPARVASTP
jgi:hypothetical protein